MATGQTLLNWMEILFPELQLQTGEADVTKGLLALNAAQDMLETHLAQYKDVMGSGTTTAAITSGSETTAFPAGLLRVDAIDMLDSSNEVEYRLEFEHSTGGHAFNRPWPWNVYIPTTTGRPMAFWTNGAYLYWSPKPSQNDTVRIYGLIAATDITASGTFLYPDICILPIATLACKLVRVGLDDPVDNYLQLAQETFNPVLDVMSRFNRTAPTSYTYSRRHET